jgi:hypothetical protein
MRSSLKWNDWSIITFYLCYQLFSHSIHINKEHYVYFFKLPANIIHNIFKISLFFNRIVKPVLQGHLWYKEKVAFKTGDLLKETQFIWHFLWQDKKRWSLNTGDSLRWYLTLQGDNSLKSVERFDHMMFVCRFQASRWSKPQREKLLVNL